MNICHIYHIIHAMAILNNHARLRYVNITAHTSSVLDMSLNTHSFNMMSAAPNLSFSSSWSYANASLWFSTAEKAVITLKRQFLSSTFQRLIVVHDHCTWLTIIFDFEFSIHINCIDIIEISAFLYRSWRSRRYNNRTLWEWHKVQINVRL